MTRLCISTKSLAKFIFFFVFCACLVVGQDFYAGFYNQYPAYRSDRARQRLNPFKPMPLGLPKGGIARASGQPMGVYAYATRMGGRFRG